MSFLRKQEPSRCHSCANRNPGCPLFPSNILAEWRRRCVIPAEAGIQAAVGLLRCSCWGKGEIWKEVLYSRFRGNENTKSPSPGWASAQPASPAGGRQVASFG